jgi:hypothetical protein
MRGVAGAVDAVDAVVSTRQIDSASAQQRRHFCLKIYFGSQRNRNT